MIITLGNFMLCAIVLIATGSVAAALLGIPLRSPRGEQLARYGVALIALLMTAASVVLLIAIIQDDFRLEYVASYSERGMPIGYKVAAFWAGQSGSLLLWGWLLAVLCWIAVLVNRTERGTETAVTVATLAAVCGFFAALMLFAANPFTPIEGMVPPDGRGLNPMLQDPGMIFHPPLLFLGYAGYTIPFAVGLGVLVCGRTDNHWIATIRRWVVVSWLFLTAGIVLGAWWAYVELGWGGYWAWDPVENASLLPWLTGTALLHSMMVQQHRGMFKRWTMFLIASTFILCIFGTFLTRSGVIESVHAFAPSLIGPFFLAFLILATLIYTVLVLMRWRRLAPEHQMDGLISREGAFLLGNVLLLIMTMTTLIGTIYPLISSVFGEPITVTEAFYNRLVAPMGILLAAVMALGPVLEFGRHAAIRIAKNLIVPGAAAIVAIVLLINRGITNPWALTCLGIAVLGTFAVLATFVTGLIARHRNTDENWVMAGLRLIDRNHRRYGGQLAHLGLMLVVVGIAGSSMFATEHMFQLREGEQATVGTQTMTLVTVDEVRRANFSAVQATLSIRDANGNVTMLRPQKRLYDKWANEFNTEVALSSTLRQDIYVILAGWEQGGTVVSIKVLMNPLVLLIWIGGIVMVAGSLFCVLPRLIPVARQVTNEATTAPAVASATAHPVVAHTATNRNGTNKNGAPKSPATAAPVITVVAGERAAQPETSA